MKRTYLKPEIKTLNCRLLNFVAASQDKTQWNVDGKPIDDDEPDPNEDARYMDHRMWNEQ